MARVSAVTTKTIINSTTFGNALITDYLSQTDTTEQNLASNLNIGSKLLKTTNHAIKQEDASYLAIRDAGDTGYSGLIAGNLKSSSSFFTNTLRCYSGTVVNLSSDLGLQNQTCRRTLSTETLGAAATTFAVSGEFMQITGDVGGNNVTTITGGDTGQILILLFVDALVTMVNDDTHAANTLDLSGGANLVSADDTTLTLIFDGTSWYELSRSVN